MTRGVLVFARQLLEWAKSKEAAEAGLGLDQAELERFVKRVVQIFTENYATQSVKRGKLSEGGSVSARRPRTRPSLGRCVLRPASAVHAPRALPQVSASLSDSCALLRSVDSRYAARGPNTPLEARPRRVAHPSARPHTPRARCCPCGTAPSRGSTAFAPATLAPLSARTASRARSTSSTSRSGT